MKPVSFIIGSIPRSGSNFLADLLVKCLQELGFDIANIPELPVFKLNDTNRHAIVHGEYGHFDLYIPESTKIIYNTRLNKVRRGISHEKLRQLLSKIENINSRMPTDRYSDILEYDKENISKLIDINELHEYRWLDYFTYHNREYYIVIYEQLCQFPDVVIPNILKYLGIDVPPDFIVPKSDLPKLSNSLSEEWYQRFVG